LTKGKRHKVVRFLISPKKKKVKIEVNKIMNPAFLLGTAINLVKNKKMKGKNGILLFVEFLKGLLEDRK
jgi:hypothetical protein